MDFDALKTPPFFPQGKWFRFSLQKRHHKYPNRTDPLSADRENLGRYG
jgi:hypothetical protein